MIRLRTVVICVAAFVWNIEGHLEHICRHSEAVKDLAGSLQAGYQNYLDRKRSNEIPFQPLRITFSFNHLTPGEDRNRSCQHAGDIVWIDSWVPSEPHNATCSTTVRNKCWYTCTADDILTTRLRTFVETLVKDAVSYLQYSLRVRRVGGNLTLPGVPCSTRDVALPAALASTGVPNSDVHLFVTGRPIIGETVAQAVACSWDQYYRPTSGHVNFNPAHMSLEYKELQQQTLVSIHEICHVLGFTSASWTDGFEATRNPSLTGKSLIVDSDNGTTHLPLSWVKTVETVSYGAAPSQITKLITPALREAARLHFGCPTLNGVELENGGGSGTANLHWEKRLLNNEFLTGTASPNAVISNMTLAFLHDTGWYQADFEQAQRLDWGRGRGCAFVSGSCGRWTADDGACFEAQVHACTYDTLAKGSCGYQTFSRPLAAQYQYFGDPYVGGSVELADFCPHVGGYTDGGDCRYPPPSTTTADYQGQRYCADCRCFTGNARVTSSADRSETVAACYERICTSPTTMKVKVGPRVYYDCTAALSGKKIRIFSDDYQGHITCPDVARLCADASIDATWPVFRNVTPSRGEVGTSITIYGENFSPSTTVEIDGHVLADIKVYGTGSRTYLTATIPEYKNIDVSETSDIIILDANTGKTAVSYLSFSLYLPESVYHQLWTYSRGGAIGLIVAIVFTAIFATLISMAVNRVRQAKQATPRMTLDAQFEAEAQRIFDLYDLDASHYLDQREFRRVIRDVARLLLFRELGARELDEAVRLVDSNNDNRITVNELSVWWKSLAVQDETGPKE